MQQRESTKGVEEQRTMLRRDVIPTERVQIVSNVLRDEAEQIRSRLADRAGRGLGRRRKRHEQSIG